MSLLSIKNLSIDISTAGRSRRVIDRVSFDMYPNETIALVGESGSGKSLTGLAIMQLLPVAAQLDHSTEIIFNEQDLTYLPEIALQKIRGKKIAMIFQEAITAMNAVMTIGEQIEEVLRCHTRLKKKARKQKILDALNDVGLPDPERIVAAYPHQLSGGMKQRAMIAMALAAEPDLVVADEPTTALDVTLQAQVLALLKQQCEQRQMSLLFITHDLGIVSSMADRVLVMEKGRIVESADKATFFREPKHAYSRALLNAVPDWQAPRHTHASTAASEPTLRVDHMSVHFPIKSPFLKRTIDAVRAVDDLSFNLTAGRTLALVGESGSGKTTTGKALLRLIEPTAGEIFYHGNNLCHLNRRKMRAVRRDLQFVFQDPYASLDPRMMVGDIIAEGMLSLHGGQKRSAVQSRVTALLYDVGLESDMVMRYPHEFSGGQRQRICIARALAVNPKVLVLDEPTSALDVTVQQQIMTLLETLQKKHGLAYLLITHNLGIVAYLAHDVAVMYQGKIVEMGPIQSVLSSPQHDYTKKLLSAVPTLPTTKVRATKEIATDV